MAFKREMAKLATILTLIGSMLITLPAVHGVDKSPGAVEKWFKNLAYEKEKLTKLHFYFHDRVSGKNPTAVQVARPSTAPEPHSFGQVSVMDDPLTTGPEPNSTVVGWAQGMYAFASLEEFGLLEPMNFYFTSGEYNGSTLSILGRNAILDQYREMPVVGGSGVFRLARGIATAQTYTFNMTSGDAIVEYHVIVSHYQSKQK